MTTGVLHIPLTAFQAYGTGLGVTAHNLANVLTPGFRPGSTAYADLPGQSGVAATAFQPPRASGQAGSRPSGTDVAREMVNLIVTSRTYQANAKVAGAADAMLGAVIDLVA